MRVTYHEAHHMDRADAYHLLIKQFQPVINSHNERLVQPLVDRHQNVQEHDEHYLEVRLFKNKKAEANEDKSTDDVNKIERSCPLVFCFD